MKNLIINADDYGMSQSTNEAVEDLFENGYITSTTLMTPCPWAEDAIERAKKNTKMKMGLHTTLTSEWGRYRWKPVSRTPVPSLLDKYGYMHKNVKGLLEACTETDVETELNAQLDFMLERDYRPTHIDNHMGSVYGLEGKSLLEVIFKLCSRDAYPFRLPRYTRMLGKIPFYAKIFVKMKLKQAVQSAESMGIGILDYLWATPGRFSESDGYDALKRRYLEFIAKLPDGLTEIYMHPAVDSKELRAITGRWYIRTWEYRFLKDPDLKETIDAAGIKLTAWTDVKPSGKTDKIKSKEGRQ